MKEVVKSFPHPIPEVSGSDVAVYHNGYHSRASYGAASYLVVRDGGNVMVDSPRYFGPLEQKIRALGGIEYMFLSHEDDVADHERWFVEISPPPKKRKRLRRMRRCTHA
jgi:hypothetical protein